MSDGGSPGGMAKPATATPSFYRAGSGSKKPRSGTQSEPRAPPAPRSGIA